MFPGSYFYTLDWQEAKEGHFLLKLPNVQPPSSGIYSATYLEASPLGSAFFRLIVRGKEQRVAVSSRRRVMWILGCGSPQCPGSQKLPQSSAAEGRRLGGEGQLLKTLSARLWGQALGTRLH